MYYATVIVKATILNAYELVPEAYRQKFRKFTRSNGQTFVEFANCFDRWYRSLKIEKNYEELKEVVLMEEFKNSVPLSIKTHLEEHQINKLKKAAVVADDYELTHKMSVGKTNQSKGFYKNTDKGKSGSEAQSSTGSPDPTDKKPSSSSGAKWDQRKKSFPLCDYCHKKGHSKAIHNFCTIGQIVNCQKIFMKSDPNLTFTSCLKKIISQQPQEANSQFFAPLYRSLIVNKYYLQN